MAGLDVTHQFQATAPRIEQVEHSTGNSHTCSPVNSISFCEHNSRHDDMEGAAVHDPLAVLALSHRQLFESVERSSTSLSQPHSRNAVDQRTLIDRPAANCTVLTGLTMPPGMSPQRRSLREALSGDHRPFPRQYARTRRFSPRATRPPDYPDHSTVFFARSKSGSCLITCLSSRIEHRSRAAHCRPQRTQHQLRTLRCRAGCS